MKDYYRIDYKQRPSSYWNDETLEQAILKNIKGDFRREEIRKALAAGNMEAIPEEILQEALSENVRSFTGRIHPRFMGGEYLPDLEASEVEIARISLQSTTFDVISIRARRTTASCPCLAGRFPVWRRGSQCPIGHSPESGQLGVVSPVSMRYRWPSLLPGTKDGLVLACSHGGLRGGGGIRTSHRLVRRPVRDRLPHQR